MLKILNCELHLHRRAQPRCNRRHRRRLQLYRVPRNKGALSLIYDGIAKLEVEGRA